MQALEKEDPINAKHVLQNFFVKEKIQPNDVLICVYHLANLMPQS